MLLILLPETQSENNNRTAFAAQRFYQWLGPGAQRPEARDQRSEIRDQRSEIRGQSLELSYFAEVT